MKTSDLLVKCLEEEGVRYVFCVPGEEIEDIMFSLENSKIKLVVTRHEQGAAFMADVWGRLTGQAAVCLATLGPGATNLITGLADAHLDKAPVVAITGQGDMRRLHKESHQLIDIVTMFRPIVKWNTSVHDNWVLTESVRKAFKLATMEKPGVTHIEIPEDIAASDVEAQPIKPQTFRRGAPDYKALNAAIELLKKSKKPILIAGNGAIRKLAARHLRAFVDKTGIPVISTFMGKGAVSDRSPHSLFTMGMKGRDYHYYAIQEADLVLSVGYDIAEFAPEFWNISKKPIIHVDFEPAEVYEYYDPEVEIVADISATLWGLNQHLERECFVHDGAWYAPYRAALAADFDSYRLAGDDKLTVPGLLHTLRGVMEDDDIIISDVGAHKIWIGRNFPVYSPGTCIISNGLASMGIAVPGGIAAKLARPNSHVFAVNGDGGFLMNSQEIETAKRYGVAYTIIIVNDNDYGLISWKQTGAKGRAYGTTIANPDFVKYVESFGVRAYNPKNVSELERDLKETVKRNELSAVIVDIDPSVNLELSKKLSSDLSKEIKK